MGNVLDVALSLGIGVHALSLIVFVVLFFVMGPEKRWMTAIPCLACFVAMFTYMFAIADDVSVAYIGLGIYRGLFELQRAYFLRLFFGPTVAILGLVFVANALGTYTYDIGIFPTIVAFIATVCAYFLALLMLWLFNRMKDKKEVQVLVLSAVNAAAIILTFSLSDAIFNVMSPTVEFFLYVGFDIMFAITPAVAMAFAFRFDDFGFDPFMNVDRKAGAEEGFLFVHSLKADPDLPKPLGLDENDLPPHLRGLSPADVAKVQNILSSEWTTPDEL